MTTSYFLLFFFLAAVASVSSEDCTYTILVKTGDVRGAGTNSKISATLKDGPKGSELNIPNLEHHGRMGSGHDYFERNNLDTFSIDTTCLPSPVCYLILSSDNTGASSGWYVDYVEVLTTRGSTKSRDKVVFDINGWFATSEPPYLLTRPFDRCANVQQINSII